MARGARGGGCAPKRLQRRPLNRGALLAERPQAALQGRPESQLGSSSGDSESPEGQRGARLLRRVAAPPRMPRNWCVCTGDPKAGESAQGDDRVVPAGTWRKKVCVRTGDPRAPGVCERERAIEPAIRDLAPAGQQPAQPQRAAARCPVCCRGPWRRERGGCPSPGWLGEEESNLVGSSPGLCSVQRGPSGRQGLLGCPQSRRSHRGLLQVGRTPASPSSRCRFQTQPGHIFRFPSSLRPERQRRRLLVTQDPGVRQGPSSKGPLFVGPSGPALLPGLVRGFPEPRPRPLSLRRRRAGAGAGGGPCRRTPGMEGSEVSRLRARVPLGGQGVGQHGPP